jgi:hypothetical protein
MARTKNKIAPNEGNSIVAMEKMAATIEKANELYGDGQPFDEERVLDCIVFRAERSAEEQFQFGKYCLWLKETVGHGRFMEGLERRNVNYFAANWAMLIYEKLGSNFAARQNLGSHKLRAITFFTKEEIDLYAQGGPLGDIPHDDVTNMTTRELEAEVRRLRKEKNEKVDSLETVIKKKSAKIDELEYEIRHGDQLTKEKKAEKVLQKYRDPIIDNLLVATERIKRATDAIDEAQKIPHVPFEALEELIEPWKESFGVFLEAAEDFSDAFNNIHVDKGRG